MIVSQSFTGGASWSAPVPLMIPGDQFQPWSAYDTTGHLRIGTFDRSVDPANHQYGYTVATETSDGSLTFNTTTVSTVNSDPTTGDRWFAATLNPAFPFATSFLGDYSNIAVEPDGSGVSPTGPTCETPSRSQAEPDTEKTPTSRRPRRPSLVVGAAMNCLHHQAQNSRQQRAAAGKISGP